MAENNFSIQKEETSLKTKPSYQISIPKPCGEDWDGMQPSGCGKYCGSCEKTVVDFRAMADNDIIKILEEKGNVCGRFTYTQLDRPLLALPAKRKWLLNPNIKKMIAALIMTQAFIADSAAQQKKKTQTNIVTKQKIKTKPVTRIYGRVLDLETQLPLWDMKVNLVFNTGFELDTVTDKNGGFSFNVAGAEFDSVKITATYVIAGNMPKSKFLPTETLAYEELNAMPLVLYQQRIATLPELKIISEKDSYPLTAPFGYAYTIVHEHNRKPTFWQKVTSPFRKKKG